MRYVSTRGTAPVLGFQDVLLTGLAGDGGLYLPETWPEWSAEDLRRLAGRPYADVAFAVMRPFVGDEIPEADFRRMIDETYARFDHPAVTPLRQLDANQWLLELFHGPTLAFKDLAMQLLARLIDWALEAQDSHATIIGATSGDTGGAAVEAFRGSRRAHLFILHPHGRVSEVQRRQMTTVDEPNVHNIAIQGNFDDCQALVKAMFNDRAFRERNRLAGVNSINWARIMAQTVYYVTAALALGAPGRPVSFAVPTGNFGDVFAGWAAKRMGLPIDRLVIATNVNDILHRTLQTGRYEVTGVQPTASPSMDIQVSSNFERLLFEATGRDAGEVARLMQGLAQSGAFTVTAGALEGIRAEFSSHRCDEDETSACIAATWKETGELLDPHTAVGYAAARNGHGTAPMVTLATAHPAKFPDAVEAASGVRPMAPARLAELMDRPERYDVLPGEFAGISAYIEANSKPRS
ncbi:MAG TPA: threonine synthase [Aestuariivirgaceae bacterium]|nr:threonine synthase [Aestuariivirgaceae bacterium]